MKINELLDMTLRDILENYVTIQSLECGYYYGIVHISDLEQIDKDFELKKYIEEYGESFFVENLVADELLIDCDKNILDYDKLTQIMQNLGISKKGG